MSDQSWRYSGDRTPGPPRYQEILNQAFPPNARDLRDQPAPISVVVRVEWQVDGVEWIEGIATRWDPAHVFVEFSDPRKQAIGVWVRPGDVARR